MILEILLFLCVGLLILIFFYKQAIMEFRLAQTDTIDKVPGLMKEKLPIISQPFPIPFHLWTAKEINERYSLSSIVIPEYNVTLSTACQSSGQVSWTPEFASKVALITGLPVWAEQFLKPIFTKESLLAPIYSYRTEVYIGPQGLQKTYGLATILAVTDGTAAVTLLNEQSDPYLPLQWKGKIVSNLTRDDAPLIGHIQCIDVILRPGSCLIVPPHWKYCMEMKDSPQILSVKIVVNHPISYLMEKAGSR